MAMTAFDRILKHSIALTYVGWRVADRVDLSQDVDAVDDCYMVRDLDRRQGSSAVKSSRRDRGRRESGIDAEAQAWPHAGEGGEPGTAIARKCSSNRGRTPGGRQARQHGESHPGPDVSRRLALAIGLDTSYATVILVFMTHMILVKTDKVLSRRKP